MVAAALRMVESAIEQWLGPRRGRAPALLILIMVGCWAVLISCAATKEAARRRLARAQTKVFKASYDAVFPAVVEVLSRDYTITRVEPVEGAVETAPKTDVVLNTGEFHGVYNLKVRAVVTSLEDDRTQVRLRVLAGRLLDFVENRWEYKDFGTPQYYREYFRVIHAAVDKKKGLTEGAIRQ